MQYRADEWLNTLSAESRFKVFRELSVYLSSGELKKVMEQVQRGGDLLAIHRRMGLLHKYQVDLIRIREQLRL